MEKPITGEKIIEVTQYDVYGNLPDVFMMEDGTRVKTPEDWEKRRKEIYKTAVELQYGTQPPKPEILEFEPLDETAPGGICSYLIRTGTKEKQVILTMKVVRPEKKFGDKVPAVVCGDASFKYWHDLEMINAFKENGIALVLFDRLLLAHDVKNEGRSKGELYKVYPEYTFGAIGAWAWGYSRCVDVLEQLDYIDTSCIAFTGHSRGGKTAMLAGVLDERCAIVNPNETCQGSCSCYRVYMRANKEDGSNLGSESLKHGVESYGFWFGEGMAEYVGREAELPFDSHYLKALVAPRVLCDWEAASDIWANPIGSWQTSMAATEVYKFLGCEENMIWYFRTGTHFHTLCDIQQLVAVINNRYRNEPLPDTFFKTPFKKPELIFDWRCPEK